MVSILQLESEMRKYIKTLLDEEDPRVLTNTKLLIIASCQVCQQRCVRHSFKLCASSHALCELCSNRANCPCCDQSLSLQPPKILTDMLKELPAPCYYTGRGCRAAAVFQDHHPFCEWRPIKCFVSQCDWEDSTRYLEMHVKNEYL
ncbi:hypothetical protein J6590_043546 [Homalodisca vitripennis]|nr:hypothetical protein J6590_043546 [Homalodisca vitripennis]